MAYIFIIVTLPIHYVPFDVPFVVAVFEAEDSSVVCAVALVINSGTEAP